MAISNKENAALLGRRIPGTSPHPKSSLLYVLKRDKYLYLLALPGVLFFLLFKYVPLWGISIAFMDYSPYQGFWGSPWVGLDNFQRLFANPDFFHLFRNTIAISLMNLFFYFPLPILLAILLTELKNELFKKTIQTIIYMPHFLSWVIIAGITFLLLSQSEGVVNKMLLASGFQKIDFLTRPQLFWPILTLQTIWKDAGWGTILFLAAIAGINPQLYEAAKIDGADRLRQIWHITLPSIRNVIVILLILRIGHMMDVGFEQVLLMANSAVSDVADVFDTYVFRVGIQQGEFSYSTAVGIFKSVVGLTLVVIANKFAKKMGEEGVY